jgi:hypothetical protein
VRISAVRLTPRRQLLVVTLAFLVVRLALTIPRTGPVVVADELGYLANARVLAGGIDGQLSTAPFYHGGYSLLLAPIVAVFHNPETSYRLVLVLNAFLAATLAPLVYLLLTRCCSVRPHAAVWPALAAAAYPSVTIYTQVAMSENLLLPLLVLWLLCAGCLLQAASSRRQLALAAATAACAAWLWATHGRMIVVVALTIVLFAVLLWRRTAVRPALLGLAVIAVGLVAAHLLDHFLVTRNWDGHAKSEVSGRLSTIESVGGVGAFLRNLVGQSWYVAVATLGVLLAAALPFDWRAVRLRFTPAGAVLALAVLTGLGLLVESALSFRTTDRPDMLIYGRYTDVVVPPLLALALVRLNAGRRIRVGVVATVLVVATAAAVLLRTTVDPPGLANRWNVASLPAPTFQLGPKVLLLAGAVAVVCLVAVVLARRRIALAAAPLVLLLFVPTTAVIERNPVLRAQSVFYPSGWTSPQGAAAGAGTISFDTDGSGNVFVYQWFAPNARLVLFSGKAQRPSSRLVFSSPEWAASHQSLTPRALWADPSRDAELFRVERGG